LSLTCLGGMTEMTQDKAIATRSTSEERTPGDPRRRLFVMRSGSRLFAVYTDEVEATSENLTPTPLPFARPPVRGVVSQRGRILTVIDPLLLLQPDAVAPTNAPPPAPSTTRTPLPIIVALRGDEQLALAVEHIEHDIELYDDETAADAGAKISNSPRFLRRIIQPHTNAIALLDPAHLFDAAMQGIERRRRRT
ncbi:MAG: chemotaxis protein CheW, partial [Acidobacteria bacterium]|nr:chemotaxis protein CheW [Acidobacteriota bacterium]